MAQSPMKLLRMSEFEPCIGCGYCCQKTVCFLGQQRDVKANDVPCPMLIWDGQRHWCKIILQEPRLHEEVAIGKGCPSTLYNNFRVDIQNRTGR